MKRIECLCLQTFMFEQRRMCSSGYQCRTFTMLRPTRRADAAGDAMPVYGLVPHVDGTARAELVASCEGPAVAVPVGASGSMSTKMNPSGTMCGGRCADQLHVAIDEEDPRLGPSAEHRAGQLETGAA